MSVTLTTRGDCALITLDRPAALNALSFDVITRIGAAIDEVATMKVRALVITGAGTKSFCAGADIKELQNRSMIEQRRGVEFGQATFARLDRLGLASIAAINGYAFGGGLELALACTFRIAAPTAKLGLPEIKLGLIPGYGGTQRLPRVVGPARALELIMTGRTVEAQEALAIGLVNRIAGGDTVEAALDFATGFTRYGLPALELARRAVLRSLDAPLHEGLETEADLSTLAYQTRDAVEGLQAFVDKRKPEFKDI
ncbi:enoyl-CoA hydratase/isomerase family protein [Pseudogemmobacter sonorensis]|uniref:enoyl-CoA hydratase/isomerase family protein n=1 Tax=Pseudogemmobacter sonorensis TaxID=2989681 RepID=UPI0036A4F26A